MLSPLSEREFYLDEFRGHTLVVSLGHRAIARAAPRRRFAAVVRDLIAHDARLLVVLGDPPAGSSVAARRRALGLPPGRARRGVRRLTRRGDTIVWRTEDVEASLAETWRVLRERALGVVVCDGAALAPAARIAERLRAHKLVVVDPAGGLLQRGGRRAISFLDEATLDVLLSAGEAEFQGMRRRRPLLAEIDRALRGGVGSVNLCTVVGLEQELFTYEGSGTLFTRGPYCRVERLGIDDFDEVERLVARGQTEGLLKPRTVDEVGELLLNGYGAWIGAGHLAGIAALRTAPYERDAAGEVIGLYTITRFHGEGIGYRLVRRLVEEARHRELECLFAVTTADGAARFFRREGFLEVGPEDVPVTKWSDYDTDRRAKARVFRRDVS